MDLSTIKDLDQYERRLQIAEAEYFDRYAAWQNALYDELENQGEAYRDNEGEGPMPSDVPRLQVTPQAVLDLAGLLTDYAASGIFAYLRSTSSHTTAGLLDSLEAYAQGLLLEAKERKWEPAQRWLRLYFNGDTFAGFWSGVEADIRDLLWVEIQPRVWKERSESTLENGSQVAEEIGAVVSQRARRREMVQVFLARCNSSLRAKILKRHIWQAVNHENPRQFQFWQAADTKATKSDDRNFCRVLAMKPSEFERLLKQKGLLK